MPIRFDDPRPAYMQLAAELRDAIATGDLKPGDRLPSTRQLADEHGIAPMTVQHAVRMLREEGLVQSQQGRGVFVAEPQEPDSPDSAAEGPSAPKSVEEMLDDALAQLAQMQLRLDRLEAAQGRPTEPEYDAGPAPDQSPGIDM